MEPLIFNELFCSTSPASGFRAAARKPHHSSNPMKRRCTEQRYIYSEWVSGIIVMEKMINGELLNVPRHVAIIMDGNGRWAKRYHMPRTFGHKRGASVVEKTCENADEIGIKYLTLYAFSTENWKRPDEEVGTLMDLFYKYLEYIFQFVLAQLHEDVHKSCPFQLK